MAKRDEYVERVKNRLDEWNADIKKLEDAYAKAEAGARLRLREQIESLRRHRQQAQEQVRRIEDAAEEVWHEIARGAEEAWRLIGDVFSGHRSAQSESPPEEPPSEDESAFEAKAAGTPSEDASAVETKTTETPVKKKAPAQKSSKKRATKSA